MRKHAFPSDPFLHRPPEDPPGPTDPPADPPADPPPAPPGPTPPAPAAEPPKPADESVTMPKAEVDALRRKVAEGEKEKRQAARDKAEADEKLQREQGQYKELADAKAAEAAAANEKLAKLERDQRVDTIARRLKFRDPADVRGRLTAEESDDDTLAENALEKIAAASPHLIDKPAPPKPEIGQVLDPTAPIPGTPGSQIKDVAYYEALSAKDLAALPDDEHKTAIRLMAASKS